MKNPVVHFEIAADDTKRARKFYSEVFDWEMNEFPEMNYTTITTTETDQDNMVQTKGAINGGIMEKGKGVAESNIVVSTDDINETAKKVKEAGGEIIVDVMDIPEIGKYIRFKDSEGNTVGALEPAR